MAVEVIMPRVDMDMTEGKIAHWYAKDGDRVRKGQVLFEIETDKATMEVDATADGVLRGMRGETGEAIPVGTTLGWILADGETLESVDASVASTAPNVAQAVAEASTVVAMAVAVGTLEPCAGESLRATPLARSLARENQVDLASVPGSGPDGRIQGADVAQLIGRSARRGETANPSRLHLNWFNRGAGAPLVLLHGFGADQGGWRNVAGRLDGLPVLGIDLPNHGKSQEETIRSIDELADAVVARLDAEGVQSFHLAGHSLGGAVALGVSARVGGRLKSLTLLAPAGLGPEMNGAFIDGVCRSSSMDSLRPWLAQLFHDASLLTPSFVATAFQQLESPRKREALKAMAQALLPDGTQAFNLRSALERLAIPSKVIWGTDDRIIPMKHGIGLPPRVALHLISGAGHLVHVETPEIVLALLREQLR